MGEILPKKFYLRGFGLGEHPKKFGTSYLFLQPLKLATSNLEHKLGLGGFLVDVINCAEFCGNRLRGYDSVGGQNLQSPIDLAYRR